MLIRPRFAKPRLTTPGRNPMTRFPLRRAACDRGGVAERLKAADCKSADVRLRRFESYPLHQRSRSRRDGGRQWVERQQQVEAWAECGCSSMVELQPSKLATWVRFPSPAPPFFPTDYVNNNRSQFVRRSDRAMVIAGLVELFTNTT